MRHKKDVCSLKCINRLSEEFTASIIRVAWRQQPPLKRLLTSTRQHGATSQKTGKHLHNNIVVPCCESQVDNMFRSYHIAATYST
jgi:hypothetical protein